MGRTESGDEIKLTKISRMGVELGELHYDLWRELVWLHFKWWDYKRLFGTSKERIDTLNAVAPRTMFIFQSTLWRDILLHLCRLTDPPIMRGAANLTVNAMEPLIVDTALRADVAASAREATMTCSFARDRRNRVIAHIDLLTARNQHPRQLEPASRNSVQTALAALAATMNLVETRHGGATCLYDFDNGSGDAEDLFAAIEAAARERERRHRQLRERLERFGGTT